MCGVLGISSSAYYAWRKRSPSARSVENKRITEQIRLIHDQSKQSYGSPRITEELVALGEKVSRPRIARLMKKANIRSKVKRKFVVTTDSEHDYPVAKNLLDRQFEPGGSTPVWVSDLTYIRTLAGWLYLTVILHLNTRKVIGWSLSETMDATSTSVAAYQMAVLHRAPTANLIFHSDRGVQYACTEFKALLSQSEVRQSMSRKGNCWDNAVAESFFKSLKVEWLYGQRFENQAQAQMAVFEYIECWYNTRRRHSAINYLTPNEFEQLLLNHPRAVCA